MRRYNHRGPSVLRGRLAVTMPSKSRYAVRAPVTKEVLRQIERLPESQADAVLESFGSGRAGRIRKAIGVSWIDGLDHLDLLEALGQHLPEPAIRSLFERCYLEGFSSAGLVKGFIDAALRLWSANPLTLAKALPRAWDMLTCEAGHFRPPTLLGPEHLQMEIYDLNVPSLERTAWLTGFEGTFEGFMTQTRCVGEARVRDLDPTQRTVSYELRWELGSGAKS